MYTCPNSLTGASANWTGPNAINPQLKKSYHINLGLLTDLRPINSMPLGSGLDPHGADRQLKHVIGL